MAFWKRNKATSAADLVSDAERQQRRELQKAQDRTNRLRNDQVHLLPKRVEREVARVLKELDLRVDQEPEVIAPSQLGDENLFRANVTLADGSVLTIETLTHKLSVRESAVLVDGAKIGWFSETYAGRVCDPTSKDFRAQLGSALAAQLTRPAIDPVTNAPAPQSGHEAAAPATIEPEL